MKNYLDRFIENSVLIPATEYSTLGTIKCSLFRCVFTAIFEYTSLNQKA